MNIGKSKLVRELSANHPKAKYVPTVEEAEIWFKVINREVFDNCLEDFREIEIRRRHGLWAECIGLTDDETDRKYSKLSLNHYMLSKKHFIAVIGHEMVHHYQWSVQDYMMDHGESFLAWKPKFAKVKITLGVTQRHPQVT